MRRVKDIRLIIGGAEYTGWDSFDVETDFRQPADAFSMSAPNEQAALAGKISPGDAAKVIFDRGLVFEGVVDDVEYSGNADEERVRLTGRDKFAHLVDNSATPGTYRDTTLLTLAQRLTSDWISTWQLGTGITLTTNKLIKVEPGDTIFDVLMKVAKKDRVVLWFSADGIAHIGRPNYTQDPKHQIVYRTDGLGNNALQHRVAESWRDRYATVIVDGTGRADSTNWGKHTHRRAVDTDAEVQGPRQIILVEELANIKQARERAELEIEGGAFDGLVLNYTMAGHYGTPYKTGDTSELYDADQRATVLDEPAGIDGAYWISRRRWSLSADDLATTEVELHSQSWLA
jgi:prophage tail gpP-like protein